MSGSKKAALESDLTILKKQNEELKAKSALLKESELDTQFESVFSDLLTNELLQMDLSRNIQKLAKPHATEDIVNEIIKLIKNPETQAH
jgi:hypothetical protein